MSRLIDVAAILDCMAKTLAGTEQGEACAFAVRIMREQESAAPSKFDFASHDAAFVEWWSREGSWFHPAAIEDREEFTRRVANLAWIISANAARKQETAR